MSKKQASPVLINESGSNRMDKEALEKEEERHNAKLSTKYEVMPEDRRELEKAKAIIQMKAIRSLKTGEKIGVVTAYGLLNKPIHKILEEEGLNKSFNYYRYRYLYAWKEMLLNLKEKSIKNNEPINSICDIETRLSEIDDLLSINRQDKALVFSEKQKHGKKVITPVWELENLKSKEVTIKINGEQVKVIARGEKRTVTPEELGLSPPPGKKESQGWKVLCAAAYRSGVIDADALRGLPTSYDDKRVQDANKKRIGRLNKKLEESLGLDDKPIGNYRKKSASWNFKFKSITDEGS